MQKHEFTGVFIPAHIWLHRELIPAEKMLLGEVASLQMRTGWCTAGRRHFADWLGVELVTVTYYTKKLEKLGFLEVCREGHGTNKMRVNPERFLQDTPVATLTTPVSRTDYPQSATLTTPVSRTDAKDNNKYNVENMGGRGEKTPLPAPAPDAEKNSGNFLTVEEKLGDERNNAAGPPPAPAAGPRPSGKPRDVEFHTDLFRQIGEFYKAYPAEWTDVVRQGPGSCYTNAELVSMLDDYCSHCFANRNTYATFAQHHGNFVRWIKNQKQFERRTPPALDRDQSQNPKIPRYQ